MSKSKKIKKLRRKVKMLRAELYDVMGIAHNICDEQNLLKFRIRELIDKE